jgi:hypothetical protein
MEPNKACSCGEKHQGHICVLRSKGMAREIEHLTSSPTVACFSCGVEANAEENVCVPVPL